MPPPWRTPPCVKLPALMVIRFVPAALTCSSIVHCAPLPSATIVITAPTPMIMPSIVSIVRILLRFSAFSAISSVMNMDIVALLHHAAEMFDGHLVCRDGLVPARAAAAPQAPSPRRAGCAIFWSIWIRPSRNRTSRVPYSAMSISCVMSSTVMPRSTFSRWKMSMTSIDVRVSRLPVGSSASRIVGRVTSARAIATRCCCPPDSWLGK